MAKTGYSRAVYVDARKEATFEFTCSLCEKEKKRVEATKYCTECFVYMCDNCKLSKHDQFPLNTRHELLEKNEFSSNTQLKLKSFPTTRCKRHPGELVNMFCGDHDVICCSVCKAIDHGACTKIQHLPEAAEGVHTSKEYVRLKEGVKTLISDVEKILSNLQAETSCITKDRERVEQRIAEFRTRVNLQLDALEKKSLEELAQKEKVLLEEIKQQTVYLEHVREETQSVLSRLESFKGDNDCELFVQVKTGTAIVNEVTDELISIPKTVPKMLIQFKINNEIEEYMKSLTSLGSISEILPQSSHSSKVSVGSEVTVDGNSLYSMTRRMPKLTSGRSIVSTSPVRRVASNSPVRTVAQKNPGQFVKYTPQLLGHFDVKEKTDTFCCSISDICQLSDGNVVITDLRNKKLKKLNAGKSYKLLDSIQLPGQPVSVCDAGNSQVAVSLCEEKKIQTVSVGNKLALGKEFAVGSDCRGIVCISGKFYVCCGGKYHSGCIKVYDNDGKLRHSIPRAPQRLPSVPRYITPVGDGQHFLVTVLDNYSITLINSTGNVVSTFSDMDLKEPLGLCSDRKGQAFVCGFHSNTVVQLSPAHKKIEVILKEENKIRKPQGVCFDEERSRLLVSCSESNEISIFKVQGDKKMHNKH